MRHAVLILAACVVVPLAAWSLTGGRHAPARIVDDAVPAVADGAAGDGWTTSWHAARQRAVAEGRPVLALFTGSDWCRFCVQLEREVLATPAFRAWAARAAVPLRLDFPLHRDLPPDQRRHNEALQQAVGLRGYPTVVLLAADGTEIGRLGYAPGGAGRWIAEAERALASREK